MKMCKYIDFFFRKEVPLERFLKIPLNSSHHYISHLRRERKTRGRGTTLLNTHKHKLSHSGPTNQGKNRIPIKYKKNPGIWSLTCRLISSRCRLALPSVLVYVNEKHCKPTIPYPFLLPILTSSPSHPYLFSFPLRPSSLPPLLPYTISNARCNAVYLTTRVINDEPIAPASEMY